VQNLGPSSADGALVTDAATAGLSKTSVSCSAVGGAVCPASSTIAALEGDIHALGIRQARVRWHQASTPTAGAREAAIARIEIGRDELVKAFDQRDAIVSAGKRAGFAYVTLDLAGYRTGSHNEVLTGASIRRALPILS